MQCCIISHGAGKKCTYAFPTESDGTVIEDGKTTCLCVDGKWTCSDRTVVDLMLLR